MRTRLGGLRALALLLLSSALIAAADARVGRVDLKELVHQADCIALARVDGLLSYDGLTVARAVPLRVLKGGAATRTLYFVADPMWRCDVSHAVRGETALLFLQRAESDRVDRTNLLKPPARVTVRPFYFLSHAGRGRMPVGVKKDPPTVMIHTVELRVPEHFHPVVVKGQRPDRWSGTFHLAEVEAFIRAELTPAPAVAEGGA